jgi:hypothetical protein
MAKGVFTERGRSQECKAMEERNLFQYACHKKLSLSGINQYLCVNTGRYYE